MKISEIIEFKAIQKRFRTKLQDYVDARNSDLTQMFGHHTKIKEKT